MHDESLPACSGSADDDVWYQFTATNPTHVITVTPTTLTDAVFEVFEGTCIGGLTSWSCNDATTGNEVEGGVISGLTVGNNYYVRVYSNPLDIDLEPSAFALRLLQIHVIQHHRQV